MSRELPSFPAIRAFEAAARHLSFKDAAQELHVTQSAISHQIKSLEEFLSVTLFHRETRGVAITREGAIYLDKVSKALDSLSSATHDIRSQRAAGPLYVRATPAFGSRWLVPRIGDFNRSCPDIELHIDTSVTPSRFAEDGIDVDIRFGRPSTSELHAEPFLKSSRFPVASPGLLTARAPLRHPRDLSKYVLLHDEVGDAWKQWFDIAGVPDVDSEPGPRFAHCDLVLQAALAGQGVALAWSVYVMRDLAAGTLLRPFDIDLPSTVLYTLVCPKDSLSRPRVAAFRDWLLSAAAIDNIQAISATELSPIHAFG